MPVCAICEEVVDKVYRCAGCGVDFCKDCGDPNSEKKLCTLCMPYEAKEEEWRAQNRKFKPRFKANSEHQICQTSFYRVQVP